MKQSVRPESRDQQKSRGQHSDNVSKSRSSIEQPGGTACGFFLAIVIGDAHRSYTRQTHHRNKIEQDARGDQLCWKILNAKVEPIANREGTEAIEKKRSGTNNHQASYNLALTGYRFATERSPDERSGAERRQESRDQT